MVNSLIRQSSQTKHKSRNFIADFQLFVQFGYDLPCNNDKARERLLFIRRLVRDPLPLP